MAKGARRTFIGQITWVARAELDDLYERNDREHRAIIAALRAGNPAGARALSREHVLHSYELLIHVLDQRSNGSPRTETLTPLPGRS
jgi:DNA-binding GntR family transcriptional regulator